MTRGGAARQGDAKAIPSAPQPNHAWEAPDKTVTGPHVGPYIHDAGWSSPVARQAHNLKVVGSNPTPATNLKPSNFN